MASLEEPAYALLPEERAERDATRRARVDYAVMAWLNFFETGAGAGLTKFLPLFLAARGLDAAQVGAVLASTQVAKFAGGLVFGRLADATGGYKAVLLATNGAACAFALALTSLAAPWRSLRGLARVAAVAAVVDGQAFFGSSSGTLIDAIAVVNMAGGGASYGSLRLWAALGWGVAAVAIGRGVDAFGFSAIFVAFVAGTALASCVVAVLFKSPAAKTPGAAAPAPAGRRWYAAGATPLYFLNFFVHGCLAAFVESFLLLYVASRYPDAPSWFLGLLVLVAALCECPVFFYAQRLLDRFGVRRLLVFAQGLFALRCAAYAFLPGCVDDDRGFWYFLLLEPSHAVTFALMWSAAVEYARTAAPVERQGGAQALLRGVYYYLGVGAGSWVGGRIVKARGFHALYVAGAVGMAAWMAAWALLLRAWRPRPAAAALAPAEASTEVF